MEPERPPGRPKPLETSSRGPASGEPVPDGPYPAARMPIVRALAGESTAVDDMEIHRSDRVVPVEVWASPVLDSAGEVFYAVAVFQDIEERRHVEAEALRLHEEKVRQSRLLAGVRDVQFAILSGAHLATALDLVARRARELIAADVAMIAMQGDDGFLEIRAADGEHAAGLRDDRVPLAGSIMGEVLAMDAAAVVDDAVSLGGVSGISDPVVRLDFGPALSLPSATTGGRSGRFASLVTEAGGCSATRR